MHHKDTEQSSIMKKISFTRDKNNMTFGLLCCLRLLEVEITCSLSNTILE